MAKNNRCYLCLELFAYQSSVFEKATHELLILNRKTFGRSL